jgi:signal peptidase II
MLFGSAALLVLAADQASKHIVTRLGPGGRRLGRVTVRGTRRGGGAPANAWLLLLSAALLAAVSLEAAYVPRLGAAGAQVALGAAVGGATGNLIDRVRHARVIDFVHLGRWPPFNLADAAVTCGVTAALWWLR